jgi:hypothetical protein
MEFEALLQELLTEKVFGAGERGFLCNYQNNTET